ncbi:hypothetical protein IJ732_05625, partial [bacterium]|nr:hypothetical protein [bacterium]
ALGYNTIDYAVLGSQDLGALGSNSALNEKHTYSCHCEECVSTTSQSYDIGSRRSRWSLAMTCIEDKCERSGLYSNSALHVEDTLPCHCEECVSTT